jgi:hypothetical protein
VLLCKFLKHNDTHYNDTQLNEFKCFNQYKRHCIDTQHNVNLSIIFFIAMLRVAVLGEVYLSVVMLSVLMMILFT